MYKLSLCLLLTLSGVAADASRTSTEAVDTEVAKILSALPGETAFAFTELRDGQPELLYGVRADRRLAVGSTFKLFIFGTLVDEVNHGRRRTENAMLLRADLVGPPQSELGEWPMGSPVTVHTLALKMISISDNTATDHLHYLLGRERIEEQMAAMGHGDPTVNRPLLSTREMTMLRDKDRGLPGRAYQKLDDTARRKFLAENATGVPEYEKLDFDTGAYTLAEWYASPIDMAHALAWIEENTRTGQPAHALRAILTIDPKLPHDAQVWPFVGFKGGSEDQLLAGNWLLQNKNGLWYTLHLFYNNPTGPADKEPLLGAVVKILGLIEGTLQ
jgi:beta-lactamase class A